MGFEVGQKVTVEQGCLILTAGS
ncbi:type I toxin-antitoxin system SymE family toxin [Pantoea dispersa]|nr:type I toxin-antitoxin system SymE family toxin [Pantoea dispersa]MCT6590890.1 type I toxin-antitoxin system SymE family toxin [Pantoea dispersa]